MTSLLVLGGTSFVGRHIVESALDAGHDVTVFNRGKTNPDLFPTVERLVGDRATGDYSALAGRQWDACIDVNAYFPHQVRNVAAAVADAVDHYTYISTVSVYRPSSSSIDEGSPLLDTGPGEGATEITGETYGPLKVLCEQVAREVFDGRLSVVRPGIVAGPHDPTDRFTYWVRRVTEPGPILACRPESPVQVVHARDLADLTVSMTDKRVCDTVNGTGPTAAGVRFDAVLDACASAAGVDLPEIVWVDESFVAEHAVPLPLHLAAAEGADGLFRASCARAESYGLGNRTLELTAADTLAWDRDRGVALKGMLDPTRESELLALHSGQQKG